jgi:hypothetical protein
MTDYIWRLNKERALKQMLDEESAARERKFNREMKQIRNEGERIEKKFIREELNDPYRPRSYYDRLNDNYYSKDDY